MPEPKELEPKSQSPTDDLDEKTQTTSNEMMYPAKPTTTPKCERRTIDWQSWSITLR